MCYKVCIIKFGASFYKCIESDHVNTQICIVLNFVRVNVMNEIAYDINQSCGMFYIIHLIYNMRRKKNN